MLERKSPLANAASVSSNSVTLSESPDFVLTQVAGDEKALKKALGKLPREVGKAVEVNGRTLFRVAPKQFWVLGEAVAAAEGVYATPLSSGRTRLVLNGAKARNVLSACALIDFHPHAFKPGHFVMTGIHHTPVMIHCIGDDAFHIYALRTFALNAWEWLCDMAEGLPTDHGHAPATTP